MISFKLCYIPASLHDRKWSIMRALQTTDMAPILHSLGDKRGFMILLKFTKLGFFIPIQGTSAIMDQITCMW